MSWLTNGPRNESVEVILLEDAQPAAGAMSTVGVACEGFSTELKWMAEDRATQPVRRQLYNENSMASTSTAMTTKIASHDLTASLSSIDSRFKDASNPQNPAVGPFGVIDFRAPSYEPPTAAVSEQISAEKQMPTFGEGSLESPSTEGILSNPNDFLDWADLLALDYDDDLSFLAVTSPELPSLPAQRDLLHEDDIQPRRGAHATPSPPGLIDLESPATQELLRYFRYQVIPRFSAIPIGHKSPWKILNAAAAVQTLAEATYLGDNQIKHANLANLYAILAISAHTRACDPANSEYPSEYWQQLSDQACTQAKSHLQRSLKSETQGIGKCKYKDQLMMIIAMAAFAFLTAQQSEARCYMVDAERLLRIRGLAKRNISRKARMLHHVYTWLRIVGESTYVLHDYQSSEANIEKLFAKHSKSTRELHRNFSASRSGLNARLDDFLRLDEVQGDSDTDLDGQKDRETGLVDIHLEDLREDAESMYLQIYGVPETWLTLVSQTTRLANVLDTIALSGKPRNSHLMESLDRRIERLENMVCSLASTSPHRSTSAEADEIDTEGSNSSQKAIECMIRALKAALVIFFYRRIRNVNPWILQVHVDEVIQALHDFDEALETQDISGPGTIWPAFMAGCEAVTEARRTKLTQWMEKGYSICGYATFKVAKETMMDVWKKRDTVKANRKTISTSAGSHGGVSILGKECTWMSISREKGLWIMLV
ncbi:hypothetical protein H2200_010312 [Cladophialophora chaetospira]|uniref:Arginine metabolism regulation protein II n=1 Tax=Cladophialophora chaetospira TaxID=386627 RepID=A0AA38X174_9EURO|nr:hypothetical protein H2200_010312 [Cladophialophora chaetospira]